MPTLMISADVCFIEFSYLYYPWESNMLYENLYSGNRKIKIVKFKCTYLLKHGIIKSSTIYLLEKSMLLIPERDITGS